MGPPVTPYGYFYQSKNDPDRLLFWSRLPTVGLFVLLVLLVGKWAKELYGAGAGLLALLLAAFNITVMAHGRYVTTDLGAALGYTLSLYTFLRCLRHPSRLNLFLAGVACGFAQVAKFSAVFLVPTFAVLAAFHLIRDPPPALGRMRSALSLLKVVGAIWLIGGVVIAAVYAVAWRGMGADLTQVIRGLLGEGRLGQFVLSVTSISRPLGHYVLGLALVHLHNRQGHPAFFLGQVGAEGWWTYFPVAFLIKTQLPLLLLLLLSLFARQKDAPRGEEALLGAALIFAVPAVGSGIDIGVRHLLPIYPLLIIWASRVVHWPGRQGKTRIGRAAIIAVLTVWYVFAALKIHPHYLAYFNELIGGSKNGYRYLSDSNVDWGQDTKRLGLYLKQAGLTDVSVVCWAWTCQAVRYYIPEATPWDLLAPPKKAPSGLFAIGRTPQALARAYLQHGAPEALPNWESIERLTAGVQPIHVIGYSIALYHFEPSTR